jgi:hypothetical protein
MAVHAARMDAKEYIRILVEKCCGKWPLRRLGRGWEDNFNKWILRNQDRTVQSLCLVAGFDIN